MSPISILATTLPDLGAHRQVETDAIEGLLERAHGACEAAEALASGPAGQAAVAIGACAVMGAAAATAATAAIVSAGFAASAPMVAALAVSCAAFAAAPALAGAAAVPAASAAAQQGLETADDTLSPLLPNPQGTATDALSRLLDLVDASRGETRNPLLLPEALRSMINTATAV